MPNDWFDIVEGSELQQGDLIRDCPIYTPIIPAEADGNVQVDEGQYDVIILSQTCDLVIGRENVQQVVVCPAALRAEIAASNDHPLRTKGALQNACKNKEPAFFVLAAFEHADVSRDVSVVHFRMVYTLPIGYLRTIAERAGKRPRLRSPYKEALSNRFAAFFGRVALPEDVRI